MRVYVYARVRAAEPTARATETGRKKGKRETEKKRERRRELSSEPWEISCSVSEKRGALRRHER